MTLRALAFLRAGCAVSLPRPQKAGKSSVSKDAGVAAEWWQQSAAQGNASAQENLGNLYLTGEGVQKDEAAAVSWFQLAAEQGEAGAQFSLAAMYYNGDGVPRDYVLAYAWANLAGE